MSELLGNNLDLKLRTVLQKGSHFVIHFKSIFQGIQADFSICFGFLHIEFQGRLSRDVF